MRPITLRMGVLEARHLEEAFEKYLEREEGISRKVSVSEMDLTLVDYVPADSGRPSGMGFWIEIDGGHAADEYDLFYDEEKDGFYLADGEFIGEEFWIFNIPDPSVLFDFDTDLFRSFGRYTDSSD